MSVNYLLAYATRYGSTEEVAQAIGAALAEADIPVDCRLLREVHTLSDYNALIIGAPLFMFRWHKDALRFLSRHRSSLATLPTAVFALGPVHDPYDEKEWRDSQNQLDRELSKFPWFKPVGVTMFGGKYDPGSLRFPLKMLAGDEPASDIRDWKAIRSWAAELPVNLSTQFPKSSRS